VLGEINVHAVSVEYFALNWISQFLSSYHGISESFRTESTKK